MAIEPFRQRVPIPGGAGVTDARVGQLDSLGPAISDVGEAVLKVAEPYMKDQALKQGAADFAATGIGKDHDGNYVKPTPIGGGIVYAAAFNKMASDQYFLEVHNATETKITAHYNDPNNMLMTPEQKRLGAEAIVDGVVDGAAVEEKGRLYESLTREVRQRDLAESNFHYRKQRELYVRTFTNGANSELKKLEQAASWGDDPKILAQVAVHEANAREMAQNMFKLGEWSQWEVDNFMDRVPSFLGAGQARGVWREAQAQPGWDSHENDNFANVVAGTAPAGATAFGKTSQEWRNLIPDDQVRSDLVQDINSRTPDMYRDEEAERAKQARDDALLQIDTGGPIPLDATPKEVREWVYSWAKEEGVDIFTRNGVIQQYNRIGTLAPGLYEQVFENAHTKTPVQLEGLYQMYDAMKSMPNIRGDNVDIAEQNMKPADSAFMYHFANARGAGMTAEQATKQATAATTQHVGIKPEEVTSFLRERTGLDLKNGIDKLGDRIDDHLGVAWADLNGPARDSVSLDAAQQIAMGVPYETAFKHAGERFTNTWKRDPLSLEGALSSGKSYVRNVDNIPVVRNGQTRQQSTDWAKGAIETGLRYYGGEQTVPGTPPLKDMKAGVNLWAKSAKRTDSQGNKLFNLYYFDPKKGSGTVMLLDKNGSPITLNLGAEARRQETYANAYIAAYDASMSNIAYLRQQISGQTRRERMAGNIASGIFPEGTGITTINPVGGSTEQLQAKLNEAQRQHDERFPPDTQPSAFNVGLMGTPKAGKASSFNQGLMGKPEMKEPKRGPLYMPPYAEYSEKAMAPPEQETRLLEGTRDKAQGRRSSSPPVQTGGKTHANAEMAALAVQRGITEDQQPVELIRRTARNLGILPLELGAILDRESSFDPKADKTPGHEGLFQANADVRKKYGIDKKSTWAAQLNALVSYATDRGYRPGMGWRKLYTTINGGNPDVDVNTPDANGTQLEHYAYIETTGMKNAKRFFGQS